jgi:hypothetical protein
MFDPQVEDAIVQVSFSDREWDTVVVPHSFNAQDGQSIQRTMKRGPGYYRVCKGLFGLPQSNFLRDCASM